ncbi:hypothetical protein ALP99_102261 [Pseudomonas syringae pv. tomato]|nr:hypothetical protein ALP99_102261 [Pseudomonas syringae pv. tomato]RMQ76350.1 hypothetical protein ALQ00_102158 [Pseudomonas syringae pv. tomato]RMU92581.1 hypothetical protein ALP19_102096 [Pseudomonas syringae pv. tomato]
MHIARLRGDFSVFPQPDATGMTSQQAQAVGFAPYQRGV